MEAPKLSSRITRHEGVFVPKHLEDVYNEGRGTPEALSAIAEIFVDTNDYDAAIRTALTADRDPRLNEAIQRIRRTLSMMY